MKVIDCDAKGNVVRFYLADDSIDLNAVHGDDWNDRGCNDPVYADYICGYTDKIWDYNYDVRNANDYIHFNNHMCKNDVKSGLIPIVVAIPSNLKFYYYDRFDDLMGHKDAIRIYFGDEMEADVVIPKEWRNDLDNHRWDIYDMIR